MAKTNIGKDLIKVVESLEAAALALKKAKEAIEKIAKGEQLEG